MTRSGEPSIPAGQTRKYAHKLISTCSSMSDIMLKLELTVWFGTQHEAWRTRSTYWVPLFWFWQIFPRQLPSERILSLWPFGGCDIIVVIPPLYAKTIVLPFYTVAPFHRFKAVGRIAVKRFSVAIVSWQIKEIKQHLWNYACNEGLLTQNAHCYFLQHTYTPNTSTQRFNFND